MRATADPYRTAGRAMTAPSVIRPLGIAPDVADLLRAPERAMELAPADAVRLLAHVGALEAVLRLAAATPARSPARDEVPAPGDGLVSVDEGARIAGLTREQLLRRKAFRPSISRQGHRTLRVDPKELRRILAQMMED